MAKWPKCDGADADDDDADRTGDGEFSLSSSSCSEIAADAEAAAAAAAAAALDLGRIVTGESIAENAKCLRCGSEAAVSAVQQTDGIRTNTSSELEHVTQYSKR